uniref:Uncharacterized protein n=1 Tax=Malurus cyaneus samueli TaxID=2593467 RepID=A0A8C5X7L1_9PASS
VRVRQVRMEKEARVDRKLTALFPHLFDSRVLLGTEENQDQQAHLASRCCVDQKVTLEDPDSQALRVKMASQENVVHKVLQGLLEQEVDQVLLALKVVLLAHLVPLEAQDCLAYKECQEKEEHLEVQDQKGRGENLVAKVLTASLVLEERE